MKKKIKYNNYTVLLINEGYGSGQVHFDYNGTYSATNFGLKAAFELFSFIHEEVLKFAQENNLDRFYTQGAMDNELIISQIRNIKDNNTYEYPETFCSNYIDFECIGDGKYEGYDEEKEDYIILDCENDMFHFEDMVMNSSNAYEKIGYSFSNIKTKADQRLKLYARMILKYGGEIEELNIPDNYLSFYINKIIL
jgi:hypothetical protein